MIPCCANCKHMEYHWLCGNEKSEFYKHLMEWMSSCDEFEAIDGM